MRLRRPSERATGAIVVVAVVLGAMAIGAIKGRGVGEFAGMSLVYGHIVYEKCDRHIPPRCHHAALPRESATTYSTVKGVEVGRGGRSDFGIDADGDFGEGYVSP